MYYSKHISAIIPAHNEEQSIVSVVEAVTRLCGDNDMPLVDHLIVCDNASNDRTAELANRAGATVIQEARAGYGSACLAAIAALPDTDIVIFIDGDGSVIVQEIFLLLNAIVVDADLAIGTRVPAQRETGSLFPQQLIGNAIACWLIRLMWSMPVNDLGPLRAIRYSALKALNMQNERYGWTVEMQVKAIQKKLVLVECPVSVTKRIGQSKISGTFKGSLLAGIDIFGTIFKLRWYQKKID